MKIFTLLPLFSANPIHGQFHNHQVVRFTIKSESQREILNSLVDIGDLGLDVWMEKADMMDIRIPVDALETVKEAAANIESKVFIQNLQLLIDQENVPSEGSQSFFSSYHSTEELQNYVENLAGAVPFTIGTTYEGRAIKGIKLGNGTKTAVFNGGIHAREWISPATVTYLAEFLASDNSEAESLRSIYTFHIIPVLNPDGYEFSRSSNRMWRKNREPNQSPLCIGTDINRNFNFKWGERGASGNQCSETYYGSSSLSTREAFALDSYVKSLKNVTSYIDFHSYGQEWLYPWGWTCSETSPDDIDLNAATKAGSDAQKKAGTEYEYGPSCIVYGSVTSGTTDDHFYVEAGVKYSLTLELRDTGRYGFNLPASQIEGTGNETVQALIAFWNYVKDHS